jgi:5'-nucleotidase
MKKRPLILLTNDDGITAPGLRTLIKVMNKVGEVVVVAPDSPQSGMGHAITVNDTLYCKKEYIDDGPQTEYSTSGTPADCVKLAVNEILKRKPDLCVSGINHGSNASINVIYSGTMSAAVEAGIEGIPSIGFSIWDYNWNANFEKCEKYIEIITKNVLEKSKEKNIILNVNFPKIDRTDYKGIKICRQANSYWKETFDKRKNPNGRNYYWLTGKFINLDKGEDTDQWALNNGYISIVPVKYDMTSYDEIDRISKWNLND